MINFFLYSLLSATVSVRCKQIPLTQNTLEDFRLEKTALSILDNFVPDSYALYGNHRWQNKVKYYENLTGILKSVYDTNPARIIKTSTSKETDENHNDTEIGDNHTLARQEERNFNINIVINTIILLFKDQINNTKRNLNEFYEEISQDRQIMNEIFEQSCDYYKLKLRHDLKAIIDRVDFTGPSMFHASLMEAVKKNYKQMLLKNLHIARNSTRNTAAWINGLLVGKIYRQQAKVAANMIDIGGCNLFRVCKVRKTFSYYLVQWLRFMLNTPNHLLNTLWRSIPAVIGKNMKVIKTNTKFREVIKNLIENITLQRDILDFLDQVLVDYDLVERLSSEASRKRALVLKTLFITINENYQVNIENEKILDTVTQRVISWMFAKDNDIFDILEIIMINVHTNIIIWPLDKQRRVDFLWLRALQFLKE